MSEAAKEATGRMVGHRVCAATLGAEPGVRPTCLGRTHIATTHEPEIAIESGCNAALRRAVPRAPGLQGP